MPSKFEARCAVLSTSNSGNLKLDVAFGTFVYESSVMDPLQTAASLSEILKSLLSAVQALTQAARDMQQAPQRVKSLESLLKDLNQLHAIEKHRYQNKLHHPQMEATLQGIQSLLDELQPLVKRAKRVANRKGVKSYLGIVWYAVAGDELSNIADDLNKSLTIWLDRHKLALSISRVFEETAKNLPVYLRVHKDNSYRPLAKAEIVNSLLENSPLKVVLIHGLSGIGKSCLARHAAANPPARFFHGAVELTLGQSCSMEASNRNRNEYHKHLAAKFSRLLRCLGHKRTDLDGISLDDACQLLQETLQGMSILVFLDDVWEPDIIHRFSKLYDNNCKYLATTRNESVHEISQADKLEITKEDLRTVSKSILSFHSQLSEEQLPDEADTLIERCGCHPLTLAVVGKALRGEMRPEQWSRAIDDLHTYASQAPVPISYMNEKEAENAATVFGSFEFSLEAMLPYARDLFTSLAALSWDGPIPEACLETIWSSLKQDTAFRLVLNRLLEGSLLERANSDLLYRVHDMVALYLEARVLKAVQLVLIDADIVAQAAVAPWLFAFGNKTTQQLAESTLVKVLRLDEKLLPVKALQTVVDVLFASNTVTELQTVSCNFTNFVGPEFVRLLKLDSVDLTSAVARCAANCFTVKDYMYHTNSLVEAGAIEKLAFLVKHHHDAIVKHDAANVLARLVEFTNADKFEDVLKAVPVKEVVDLLEPDSEESHERVINALMRLAKVGEEITVKEIFTAGMDKKLAVMLESGSELAQRRAIVAIKSFHDVGGSDMVRTFLRSGILSRIPWQARLSLERFNKLDLNSPFKVLPKRQAVERLAAILEEGSAEEKIKAIQDMLPIIEQVDNPNVKDVIFKVGVIERLSKLLELSTIDHRVKSEASFALTKLSCSGGESCIRRMIKNKVVESLVEMINAPSKETQDTAYSTLHNLIETGRRLITDRIIDVRLTGQIVALLDGQAQSSIQIGLQCVQDLVLIGGKQCIEHLMALQIVEKLAVLEKVHSSFKGTIVEFAKLVEKCECLSVAERRVLNQQVLRKMRSALKDSNQLAVVASILHGLTKDSDALIRHRSHSSTSKW